MCEGVSVKLPQSFSRLYSHRLREKTATLILETMVGAAPWGVRARVLIYCLRLLCMLAGLCRAR